MAKKCIACRRRNSVSVEDEPVPPLCRPCWGRAGVGIRRGRRVICTVDDGTMRGIVRNIDGHLAVVDLDDGAEAWLPIVELVVVNSRSSR